MHSLVTPTLSRIHLTDPLNRDRPGIRCRCRNRSRTATEHEHEMIAEKCPPACVWGAVVWAMRRVRASSLKTRCNFLFKPINMRWSRQGTAGSRCNPGRWPTSIATVVLNLPIRLLSQAFLAKQLTNLMAEGFGVRNLQFRRLYKSHLP
jgi:hypothetical protein